VLGLGHIGKRVARTLADLEYPVYGWARSQHQVEGVQTFAGQDQLKAFLGETRVLVNTLPLTPETRDILNYELMTSLKPGAILINVGRGEHLVEEDLCRAIEEGHISQAVLDVFRQEPLPEEHPLWKMPQIAITPHVSARTLRDDMLAQITGKIRALEAGQEITGIVDIERGSWSLTLLLCAGRAGRGAGGEGWMSKHEDAQPGLHENSGPLPTRAALTLSPGGRGNCPCNFA